MFKRLDWTLSETVTQQARRSDRLRQGFAFHASEEKVQRTLIALQPGTYVRPHRHVRDSSDNGFEMLLVLQGAIGVLLFDEQGEVITQEEISAEAQTYGVELAEGIYHTAIALSPDTLILEIKEGPYIPHLDKEFLSHFPLEGTLEAQKLVQTWQNYF
ncbi:MAG TPA: cupin fold metalloprotein, WbuC family [Cyanobacteria bacterium UBA8803]|nr:cupin fold metalloprotein, WbuC family [Cyanobacteria bacterium UBA9273]HBL59674.1 cupin fold metalloprotein, WbuC family [Cyanobacteria bacterium UBA8803]